MASELCRQKGPLRGGRGLRLQLCALVRSYVDVSGDQIVSARRTYRVVFIDSQALPPPSGVLPRFCAVLEIWSSLSLAIC